MSANTKPDASTHSPAAVILAGGKGTRLAPYTTVLPKPLMPLGDMPVLEILLRQLHAAGVGDVVLCVGHLSSLIEAYFGDGGSLGLSIRYSREQEPLGTAGPLRFVDGLDAPFFVMNGDLLTSMDFSDMLRHHSDSEAAMTVGLTRRNVRIDLGVVETDAAGRVTGYVEKPTFDYDVSMGIYVVDPRVLGHLPPSGPFDLPDLVLELEAAGEPVISHRTTGYWLDIGRPDDFEEASRLFEDNRGVFLPDALT